MSAELHVLSGDRTGLVLPLSGAECTLGRHPACALRFGSQAERGVSARHARLVPDAGGWLLRDLGSTNGTWLNGHPVAGDTPLRDGDRISLGERGPVVEFRLVGARTAVPPAHPPPPRRRRVRGAWVAGAALAAALLAGGAAAGVYGTRSGPPSTSAAPPASSTRRTAELVPPAAFRAPPPEPPRAASSSAPARTTAGNRSAASRSASAPTPVTARPAARAEAEGAAPVLPVPPRRLSVDARNRRAVARIYVEGEDGEVSTGTAFAVRADGTLITNRHVLGRRPARIAVQFASSPQVWRARVVAVSGEWDAALVKVDDIVGSVPTVRLNLRPDTLAEGAPVALVGFPRGGEPVQGAVLRPSISHGAFSRMRAGRVEVFARSSVGASGSPLFDARGEVVGVLFGGSPGAARPLLYAVPAPALAALLAGR